MPKEEKPEPKEEMTEKILEEPENVFYDNIDRIMEEKLKISQGEEKKEEEIDFGFPIFLFIKSNK